MRLLYELQWFPTSDHVFLMLQPSSVPSTLDFGNGEMLLARDVDEWVLHGPGFGKVRAALSPSGST